MKRVVKLRSRYGNDNKLVEINENEFKFEGEDSYLRVGLKENSKNLTDLEFIDPAGGPFISIGSTIPGVEGSVSEIRQTDIGFIIKIK